MKLKALFLAAVFSAACAATPAHGWELLGTRDVRDRVDRDTIMVEGGRRYERIRFCVSHRPVHFIDVDVRFANGGHQDVQVRQRVNAGECTRAINLEGDDRNIVSVSLLYEETSRRRGQHATVRLYGE